MSIYDGLLGMSEMEAALERIVKIADNMKVPFHEVIVTPYQFKDAELIGFCHLCTRNLVDSFYPNGCFHPTQELINLMRERRPHIWGNLKNALTIEERIDKLIKPFNT